MRELEPGEAAALLAGVTLNLIRRSLEGGLVMSNDHWQLASADETTLTFAAQPPAPETVEPVVVTLAEVDRITWDRLVRQKTRSQIRFHRRDGSLLTFSGPIPEPDGGA